MECLTYLYSTQSNSKLDQAGYLLSDPILGAFNFYPFLKTSQIALFSSLMMMSLIFPTFAEVIQFQEGDRGDKIALIQKQLSLLGYYNGELSGDFDQETKEAILAFQKAENLPPTGILEENTQNLLNDKTQIKPATEGMQLGDQGQTVSSLQEKLKELGYFKGEISGFFGDLTKEAVINFQKSQNLKADGLVNTDTLVQLARQGDKPLINSQLPTSQTSLFSGHIARSPLMEVTQQIVTSTDSTFTDSYNPDTYLYQGDKGEPIRWLQQALKTTGYYQGEITGIFDQATAEAVKKFQQENQITPDGIVGVVTKAELLKKSEGINNLTPTNLPPPTNLVRRGDAGNSVRWVQEKLKIAGFFKGNITGFFGESTEVAVKDFQKTRNLPVDGIVGPQTRNALDQATKPPSSPPSTGNNRGTVPTTTLRKGNSGSSVRWVQERLKVHGFYNHEINGVFGDLTETAVRRFQQARRLTIDGIVGPQTRNILAQNPVQNTSQTSTNTRGSTVPTNLVRRGDSGNSVRWVQERLKFHGFLTGEITGFFGASTENAVKQFQRSRKLGVDGIVGEKTRTALAQNSRQTFTPVKQIANINPSQGFLKKGDSGNSVQWLQEKLTELNFYAGPITGTFGNLTEMSVKRFQSAKKLPVDGIVGRNTQIALNDAISQL